MKESLSRVFKSGWVNFKRNGYLSFGATGVMAIALFLFISLIGLNFLTDQVVSSLEEKIDISAYFNLDSKEEQILAVKSELETLPYVQTVEYVSRDKALDLFKDRHKDDAVIRESLSELDENPLQATLNIKAKETGQYALIAGFLQDGSYSSIIDKINFFENRDVITRVNSISQGLKSWGLIITITLGLIAMLVTFNTIRLTIYNQRQEIEIMKLVGASSWQIRGPYLVEGAFYGLFAALVVLAIVYPSIYSLSDKIYSFTAVDIFAYFSKFYYQIVPLALVVGIFMGISSSFFAIRKHLKV